MTRARPFRLETRNGFDDAARPDRFARSAILAPIRLTRVGRDSRRRPDSTSDKIDTGSSGF